MICPRCGKESRNEAFQCEHCGTPFSAGANWGVRKSSNTYRPQYSSDTEKLTSFVAATPALRKAKPQGLRIVAGILAILLVVAMGVMGFKAARDRALEAPDQDTASSATHGTQQSYHVVVSVEAPGLDGRGTKIPVQISGADAAGNGYDEVMFIEEDGTGLKLPKGKYGIQAAASPISADGSLFLFTKQNKWFSVDGDLEGGKSVDLRESVQLVFEPADPSDLDTDMIDAARQRAIEGGMAETDVDALLKHTRASVEAAQQGRAFSNTQTYRNVTFVGDVRTNNGFVPASGIPGIQRMLTRTNKFLFTNNTLYYADNAANDSGTSAIALHARNMSTGQESIIATDLATQTTPCFVNGQVVYTAYNGGISIKRIEAGAGEGQPLRDDIPWSFSKLVGAQGKNVVLATSDNELPQLCIVPVGEGDLKTVPLGDTYGSVLGVYGDTAVVAASSWDSSTVAGYTLEGTKLWEKDVPDGAALGSMQAHGNNMLFVANTNNTAIIRIDLAKGTMRSFEINVPYLFALMMVKDNHLYFAGSESYSSYDEKGNPLSTYTTYELNLDSGRIKELGSYEAPQDEDLARQQETWSWDSAWSYGWNNTNTTDGAGAGAGTDAGTGTAGTGTPGTNAAAGDWDANGAWIGNGQGGYDQSGNFVGYTNATGTDAGTGANTNSTSTNTPGDDLPGTNPSAGDWDANGAWVGNGQGGYDANGNPV